MKRRTFIDVRSDEGRRGYSLLGVPLNCKKEINGHWLSLIKGTREGLEVVSVFVSYTTEGTMTGWEVFVFVFLEVRVRRRKGECGRVKTFYTESRGPRSIAVSYSGKSRTPIYGSFVVCLNCSIKWTKSRKVWNSPHVLVSPKPSSASLIGNSVTLSLTTLSVQY